MAQSLLDAKERAHQGGVELQQLQEELQKAGEEDARVKASLEYPSRCARRPGLGLTAGTPAHSRWALGFEPGTLGLPVAGVSTGSPPPERGDLNCLLDSAHPRAGGAQGDRGRSGETGKGS